MHREDRPDDFVALEADLAAEVSAASAEDNVA
jgi:hypothetical protein